MSENPKIPRLSSIPPPLKTNKKENQEEELLVIEPVSSELNASGRIPCSAGGLPTFYRCPSFPHDRPDRFQQLNQ